MISTGETSFGADLRGVAERGLEHRDVAARRAQARLLGTVEQPGEPLVHDPAVGGADGARA